MRQPNTVLRFLISCRKVEGKRVWVKMLDSLRKRVYIAPYGLWLTLDAGTFEAMEVNTRTSAIRVGMSPATPSIRMARLRVGQLGKHTGYGAYHPAKPLQSEREAYNVPL